MSVCNTVPSASELLAAASGVPAVSGSVPSTPSTPLHLMETILPAMPAWLDGPQWFGLPRGQVASDVEDAGAFGSSRGACEGLQVELPAECRIVQPPVPQSWQPEPQMSQPRVPEAQKPQMPRASAAAHVPAEPVTWTPSPELAQYTALLNEANLEIVGHRTDGLRRLQQFTGDGQGTTIEQIQTCSTIKTLSFLRMSKKVRENLLNREFVLAGRAFNRELLAAKIAAARRLGAISRDPNVPSQVQRLAGAVNVRSSSGMKVEWGEINDREIPEHLLPPSVEEAMWMAGLFPVGEVVERAAVSGAVAGDVEKAEGEKVGTPFGKAVLGGTAIPGGGLGDVEKAEGEKAKTPLGKAVPPKAVLRDAVLPETVPQTAGPRVVGPVMVASQCCSNKKNRFKKRRR